MHKNGSFTYKLSYTTIKKLWEKILTYQQITLILNLPNEKFLINKIMHVSVMKKFTTQNKLLPKDWLVGTMLFKNYI